MVGEQKDKRPAVHSGAPIHGLRLGAVGWKVRREMTLGGSVRVLQRGMALFTEVMWATSLLNITSLDLELLIKTFPNIQRVAKGFITST